MGLSHYRVMYLVSGWTSSMSYVIVYITLLYPPLFFFFKILFIYLTERGREREREQTQAGGAAGRRRGKSRLPAEQGAQCRVQS